jgi:hypothetical protein
VDFSILDDIFHGPSHSQLIGYAPFYNRDPT